jgi:hypothetical protein
MSELVRKPKAVEGEVVKPMRVPLRYVNTFHATEPVTHTAPPELAYWHETTAKDVAACKLDWDHTNGKPSTSLISREQYYKPIDPTSIDKATPAIKFDAMPSAKPPVFAEPYRPNLWQRVHGYTADPATCGHHHSRFRTRWICADCGEDL